MSHPSGARASEQSYPALLNGAPQAAADENNANCCLAVVSSVSAGKTSLPWELWSASVIHAINNVHIFFSFFTERRKIKLFSPRPMLTAERRCTLSSRYWSSTWVWNIVMLKVIDFTASCLTYFTQEAEYEVKTHCWCFFNLGGLCIEGGEGRNPAFLFPKNLPKNDT